MPYRAPLAFRTQAQKELQRDPWEMALSQAAAQTLFGVPAGLIKKGLGGLMEEGFEKRRQKAYQERLPELVAAPGTPEWQRQQQVLFEGRRVGVGEEAEARREQKWQFEKKMQEEALKEAGEEKFQKGVEKRRKQAMESMLKYGDPTISHFFAQTADPDLNRVPDIQDVMSYLEEYRRKMMAKKAEDIDIAREHELAKIKAKGVQRVKVEYAKKSKKIEKLERQRDNLTEKLERSFADKAMAAQLRDLKSRWDELEAQKRGKPMKVKDIVGKETTEWVMPPSDVIENINEKQRTIDEQREEIIQKFAPESLKKKWEQIKALENKISEKTVPFIGPRLEPPESKVNTSLNELREAVKGL